MTETYIVLGMHRARTSLVSSIVHTMGVSMGDMLTEHPRINHYEDQDFFKLNKRILRVVGGDWRNPPTAEAILRAGRGFDKRIEHLIDSKCKRTKWGWKDPRNCLTWPVYTSHLDQVKFIIVERDMNEIVASLLRRDKGNREHWLKLAARYQNGIDIATETRWPRLHIDTGMLVDRTMVDATLGKLAEFLGMKWNRETVLPLIRFRK